MKKIKFSIVILFLGFFFYSCNNDDDSTTAPNFPIKLVFNNEVDEITLFKNGEEVTPSEEEINTFYEHSEEILSESKLINSFYEFIDDETLIYKGTNSDEEITVNYNFENDILNLLDFNGVVFPFANGSLDEIKTTLIVIYNQSGQISSISSASGLLEDDNIFPLTFESTKDLYHDYNNIEDINGDNKLYLFKREVIFKRE